MSRYEKIAFIVLSVSAYVAFLAGLVRCLILTLLLLFNYFVYHVAIATEIRLIDAFVEIGFGLFLLSIRRPVAKMISERVESGDSPFGKEQAD